MSLRSCGLRCCSIGALPASAPTRPISTMNTAKTQFARQPQRNDYLLRSIAYHRHYRPAAWIDPVVLRAITIPWNNIVIPVGSWRYDGHPDDGPFPWFTNDSGRLRMRCGTKRAEITQQQGRSQSYNRYPHASTSLPQSLDATRISRDVRVRAVVEGISDIKYAATATSHFMRTGGVRYSSARMSGAISGVKATMRRSLSSGAHSRDPLAHAGYAANISF